MARDEDGAPVVAAALAQRRVRRGRVHDLALLLRHVVMAVSIQLVSSPENPPRHAPIKSGDYLLSRFKTVQKYEPTPVASTDAAS